MNSSRKVWIGLGIVSAYFIMAQSACTTNSAPSAGPAPTPTSAASPSPVPGPWSNVLERTTCDSGDPSECLGAYGFTVFNNGSFQVGPGPQGQSLTGAIQPTELDTLNTDAAAVAGSNLTGNFSCLSSPAVLGPQDTLTLTIPGKTPVIVYQGIVAQTGNQCYLGNQQDTFRLHDDMQSLMAEYYPLPFPSPSASPTPPYPPVPPYPTPTLTPIRNGLWGGDGAQLQATSRSGSFQFNCATGQTNGPILVDSDGDFSVDGTYNVTGGPIVVGQARNFSATYSGNVSDNTMTLNVSYTDSDGNPVSNDYDLTYGQPGNVQTICIQGGGGPGGGPSGGPGGP